MKIWGIQSGVSELDEQIQSLGKEFGGSFDFKSAALKPVWQHMVSIFGYTHASFFEYGAEELVSPWPDIVINVHPSTTAIALIIKKRSQNKSFLINLHKLDVSSRNFDLVIAPEHEKVDGNNVITTVGYLTDIKAEKLIKKNYAYTFSHLSTPQIFILGGTKTQPFIFDEDELSKIAKDFCMLQQTCGGSLVIAQTIDPDHRLVTAIEQTSGVAPLIHNQDHSLKGALAWADIIVCLGDDFSAISKACSSGKTVLHYQINRTSPTGFVEFYQKLRSMNMIATLHDGLQQATYSPLREAERVASHICQLLHQKHKVNVLL